MLLLNYQEVKRMAILTDVDTLKKPQSLLKRGKVLRDRYQIQGKDKMKYNIRGSNG